MALDGTKGTLVLSKRKHIGTVILTILVAALLASGISGWLFWQSAQRVIGEAQ